MHTVTSADGTTIAYDQAGSGPALVFLSGAFNDRTTCAPVAEALRDRYTVVCVDRRGRGDSGDAIAAADVARYVIDREIEDLDAVIAAVGGRAAVFGFSSGATLALHAAAAGSAIGELVLYEAPYGLSRDTTLPTRLAHLIEQGRRGDAVATMQLDGIGLPAEMVEQARQSPMWQQLEAIAQTVVYDATITSLPSPPVDTETLVITGAETWPGLRDAAARLTKELAHARQVEVPAGANHTIPAAATADAVHAFLSQA